MLISLINTAAVENTAGVPEEQIKKQLSHAVCKVNIDSDGRLVMTTMIRKYMSEHPKEFDPRKI